MHQFSVDGFLTRTKSAGRKVTSPSLFLHGSDTCIINSAFVSNTESMKHCFSYGLLKLGHLVKQKYLNGFRQTISEEKYPEHIKSSSSYK